MRAMNSPLYGNYRNRRFSDIYPTLDSFLADYNGGPNSVNGIPPLLDDTSITTLYYLLLARYGNSTIASSDENQFVLKLFSTIYMYGPTWSKRIEMQANIRALTLDDLMSGGDAIYNTALNPTSTPAVTEDGSPSILNYINQQNTTKYRKSKVDAYAVLANLLETDVTEQFIAQFKKLFLIVVSPELPLWYETSIEGDDEDGN